MSTASVKVKFLKKHRLFSKGGVSSIVKAGTEKTISELQASRLVNIVEIIKPKVTKAAAEKATEKPKG